MAYLPPPPLKGEKGVVISLSIDFMISNLVLKTVGFFNFKISIGNKELLLVIINILPKILIQYIAK